jgi:hypothetical protein
MVFFDGYIDFRLNNALHLGLVLVEVIHDLAEGGVLGGSADGANVGETEKLERFFEELANAILVEDVDFFIEDNAVNFFDGLVDKPAEEDDGGAGGRKIVFAKELVLARAGFVELEVAGEAEGAIGKHSVFQGEVLGSEEPTTTTRPGILVFGEVLEAFVNSGAVDAEHRGIVGMLGVGVVPP